MASPHTIERHRGIADAGKQFGLLREKWPLAFPVLRQDVRPRAALASATSTVPPHVRTASRALITFRLSTRCQ
jgi:hypothetical protein